MAAYNAASQLPYPSYSNTRDSDNSRGRLLRTELILLRLIQCLSQCQQEMGRSQQNLELMETHIKEKQEDLDACRKKNTTLLSTTQQLKSQLAEREQTLHLLDLSVMAGERRLKIKEETTAILAKCIHIQDTEGKGIDVASLIIRIGHLEEQCFTYKATLQEWVDNRC